MWDSGSAQRFQNRFAGARIKNAVVAEITIVNTILRLTRGNRGTNPAPGEDDGQEDRQNSRREIIRVGSLARFAWIEVCLGEHLLNPRRIQRLPGGFDAGRDVTGQRQRRQQERHHKCRPHTSPHHGLRRNQK